ncbi:MAG TPA: histidine--tRNA ligase [Phycisphaerales bacterium]|nr:histidine--tRNA ligase [Phycisphaerales bacterium]
MGEKVGTKFQNVKGTRDFYPEDMRVRNWIADAWRRVSLRNGFEEYDAPIFEYLDLFTIKSGQEIAEQLFNFTDRGGRSLAIRPEITPSLARMVNAKIHTLPRPIKWFSIPRLCRAENPQKGRLREFFQWNIDIIGDDSVLADAECIFACVDFLREIGLTPEDVKVRIGSRPVVLAHLRAGGVAEEKLETFLLLIDKRPKVPPEAFGALCEKEGVTKAQMRIFDEFDSLHEPDRGPPLTSIGLTNDQCFPHLAQVDALFTHLEQMGVAEYCVRDFHVVRGLAYYTGIVYEVFDASSSLRALAGGGRYDNLLEVLGGPKVGATGFGMGDVVLGILLKEKGKIKEEVRRGIVKFWVIDAGDNLLGEVLRVVGALRRKDISAGYSSEKRGNIGKQLKDANRHGASKAILVRHGRVAIKDLATGNQADVPTDQFLDDPKKWE